MKPSEVIREQLEMPTTMPKPRLAKEERLAKRQARREKQRGENTGRAAKMHAARLAWEKENETPDPRPAPKKLEVHVGCSGWFYWDWRGAFYPAELPTNKWFARYVSAFKTVELNAPFYSWPTVGTVQGWRRQIGKSRFVYKVMRLRMPGNSYAN